MTTETKLMPRGTTAPITTNQAMYLLKTIWPKAPEEEVTKAAILCWQYNLNPLMKQVFLIPFREKATGNTNWVCVLGIKASRTIAQKKHGYSYIDGPRVMTDEEQKVLFGMADPGKIWAIVKLKEGDNIYPGYGFWLRDDGVYGSDKGNTALNMAFIRAERNALDKMAPGELPDIEATDENYIISDFKTAITEGKKLNNQRVEEDIVDLWPAPLEPSPEPVDMVWLKESLEKIKTEKPKLYQTIAEQVREWIGAGNGNMIRSWGAAITMLNREQAEKLCLMVQRASEI